MKTYKRLQVKIVATTEDIVTASETAMNENDVAFSFESFIGSVNYRLCIRSDKRLRVEKDVVLFHLQGRTFSARRTRFIEGIFSMDGLKNRRGFWI